MKNEKIKIIILHGWAYDTKKWSPFLNLLKTNNVDPVMLEIPGLTAPLDKVWTLEDYVQWLKKIVDLEKDKVILLGHSNGGRIGLAFSLKYPEKVSQLILLDSAGIYHNELPLRLKRLLFGTRGYKKRTSRGPILLSRNITIRDSSWRLRVCDIVCCILRLNFRKAFWPSAPGS